MLDIATKPERRRISEPTLQRQAATNHRRMKIK
jgi:hypothetical protein